MLLVVASFSLNLLWITLIGKRKLIFQVDEFVVDRGGREHQHLRPYTRPDDSVEQFQGSGFPLPLHPETSHAVAEVVALINDHQIIVSPVQAVKVGAVGLPVFRERSV